MVRRDSRRIWLRKLKPFVFCDDYKKRHQIQKHGEFEIYFLEKKGTTGFSFAVLSLKVTGANNGVWGKDASAFVELFLPDSDSIVEVVYNGPQAKY